MKRLRVLILALFFAITSCVFNFALAVEGPPLIECVLRIRDDSMIRPFVNVEYDYNLLEAGSTTSVEKSRIIPIYAAPIPEVEKVYYSWDAGEINQTTNYCEFLTIPNEFEIGSTHTLDVQAEFKDGSVTDVKKYYINVVEDFSGPEIDEFAMNRGDLAFFETVNAVSCMPINASLFFKIEAQEEVVSKFYTWDDRNIIEENSDERFMWVEIPDEFEIDSSHILKIGAQTISGDKVEHVYYMQFVKRPIEYVSIGFKNNDITCEYGNLLIGHYNDVLSICVSSFNNDVSIAYSWNNNSEHFYLHKEAYFTFDASYDGDIVHYLRVRAITDNTVSPYMVLNIKVVE